MKAGRLAAAVLDAVARNRFSLPAACALVAVFFGVYQGELDPPHASAVELIDVEVSKVGTLVVRVGGRKGGGTVVARREAGPGIEYRVLSPSAMPRLPGPVLMAFAPELALADAELHWIAGHGPRYRIGVIRDQVVSMASPARPLIPYERFADAAIAKRNLYRAWTALALVLGAALYILGSRHQRQLVRA